MALHRLPPPFVWIAWKPTQNHRSVLSHRRARVLATRCHTLLDDGPVTTPDDFHVTLLPTDLYLCRSTFPPVAKLGLSTPLRYYIVFLFLLKDFTPANVPLSYRASLLFSPPGNFRQHVDTWLHHTSYKTPAWLPFSPATGPSPLPLESKPHKGCLCSPPAAPLPRPPEPLSGCFLAQTTLLGSQWPLPH